MAAEALDRATLNHACGVADSVRVALEMSRIRSIIAILAEQEAYVNNVNK